VTTDSSGTFWHTETESESAFHPSIEPLAPLADFLVLYSHTRSLSTGYPAPFVTGCAGHFAPFLGVKTVQKLRQDTFFET